jgi:hypothetical protein
MPLSDPTPRKQLHTRKITLGGFQREDGLFDIEAEITDTKSYDFDTRDRVVIAGTVLHHMRARLTVNEDMEIVHAEAVTEAGPFSICGGGAETFGRLAGLVVRPGFLKAANERLGGVEGCTHLRELLQQMATVTFQTLFPVRAKREVNRDAATPPRLLNTCFAYDSNRSVVARRFPAFYTGDDASNSEAAG